jgi:type VI protein secretion system component Hcp
VQVERTISKNRVLFSKIAIKGESMKKNIFTTFIATVLFSMGFLLSNAYGGNDIFMTATDILGESIHNEFTGAIDIIEINEGQFEGGGTITAKKYVDLSSIPLRIKAASGDIIPEIEIFVSKAGDTPFVFWKMRMQNVKIKTITMEGFIDDTRTRITEKLELSPESITWTYVPQYADGSTGAEVVGSFDYKTGK